ncbi:MAG TPA: hypothetical protein VE130_00010 [Nitrososphaeraceae archaeon]|nr:hypothetical protein [Nitrososphaeraceae archaeon]
MTSSTLLYIDKGVLQYGKKFIAQSHDSLCPRLVITESKTTWRMPRELHKDLKRYALENDTNVTAVVLRACREFLLGKGCSKTSTKDIQD